jgi:LytTr DNA-binding domain
MNLKRKLIVGVIIALIISQFFIFIGDTPSEVLRDNEYYVRDSVVVFTLVFLVLLYYYFIHHKYLYQISFEKQFVKRLGFQFLLGLFIPALLVWLVLYYYLIIFQGNTFAEVTYATIEFPVSVAVLVALNILFIAIYYFTENEKIKTKLGAVENELFHIQGLQAQTALPNSGVEESETPTENKKEATSNTTSTKSKTSIIIVSSGKKNLPIATNNIAYIFKSEEYTFLQTRDGNKFMMNYTLEELMGLLDDQEFFRANRQIIISLQSCQSFCNEENGKISLELSPSFQGDAIISQKKAPEFRKWLER